MVISELMSPMSEATAVKYGLISARFAGILHEFILTSNAPKDIDDTLEGAGALVSDIALVRVFYRQGHDSVAPGSDALDAYSCALQVVLEQRKDFGIDKFEDLVGFIDDLSASVKLLRGGTLDQKELPKAKTAELFFSRFSQRMLMELNRSKDPFPQLI